VLRYTYVLPPDCSSNAQKYDEVRKEERNKERKKKEGRKEGRAD